MARDEGDPIGPVGWFRSPSGSGPEPRHAARSRRPRGWARTGAAAPWRFVVAATVLAIALTASAAGTRQAQLDEAAMLNAEAWGLKNQRRPADGLPLIRRALAIRERLLGPDHPLVATSRNLLALMLVEVGQHAEAERLYRRVLAIMERQPTTDPSNLAAVLLNLGVLYDTTGQPARAEPLLRRSLAIRERQLGSDHPDVARALQLLASVIDNLGQPARAEPLLRRSLAIRERQLGADHPEVAQCLNDLAELHQRMGRPAPAEPLLRRSLAIAEQRLGPEHPDVATGLNNLALLYKRMGQHAQAEALLRRSLAIRERRLGRDHPEVAASLNNLAALYASMRRPARAAPLYRRSLAIWEQRLGPSHPHVATALNNLAALYPAMGQPARAEPLYRRSLAIREQRLGAEHPDVASSLHNLAALSVTMGQPARAEPLYRRSLAIWEQRLGPDHPTVAVCLSNLAALYLALDQPARAEPLHRRSLAIRSRQVDEVFSVARSEEAKHGFIATLEGELDAIVSAALLTRSPYAVRTAVDALLRYKGIVLEAMVEERAALAAATEPRARQAWTDLVETRRQHATLTLAGPDALKGGDFRQTLEELTERRAGLERVLSNMLPAFSEERRVKRADADAISQALPPGAVLVEIGRPNRFDFKRAGPRPRWRPARYVAFVLRRGEQPQLVDLGAAAPIDTQVAAVGRLVRDAAAELRAPGTAGAMRAEQRVKAELARLWRQVLGPVAAQLARGEQLVVSPDGALSLVPFGILVEPSGRYLVEEREVAVVSSGRDVLRWRQPPWKPSPRLRALVLGDPDFGAPTRGAQLVFGPLPGTRDEAGEVARLLGVTARVDAEASEGRVRASGPVAVLHLATHGYFQDQVLQPQPALESERGTLSRVAAGRLVRVGNPMLRSGLALAGANVTYGAEALLARGDDGLLTAEEAAALDLRGTELVVLSACDTGRGEVRRGEGVYGLRRAFEFAGARSVVMSLWPVPDAETRTLMVRFYRGVMAGQGKSRALRAAMLQQIETLRTKHGAAHPYHWGAFVLVGDPR